MFLKSVYGIKAIVLDKCIRESNKSKTILVKNDEIWSDGNFDL